MLLVHSERMVLCPLNWVLLARPKNSDAFVQRVSWKTVLLVNNLLMYTIDLSSTFLPEEPFSWNTCYLLQICFWAPACKVGHNNRKLKISDWNKKNQSLDCCFQGMFSEIWGGGECGVENLISPVSTKNMRYYDEPNICIFYVFLFNCSPIFCWF